MSCTTCNWLCCGPQNHYTQDYTNVGRVLSFQLVFAIMFNGCTGIMGESVFISTDCELEAFPA